MKHMDLKFLGPYLQGMRQSMHTTREVVCVRLRTHKQIDKQTIQTIFYAKVM